MKKAWPVVRYAVQHPAIATAAAVVVVAGLSLGVVISSLDASGIALFPLAIVLSIAMPAILIPAIVYPLLAMVRRQQALHTELERMAHVDALTNLPNRRAFFEFAKSVVVRPMARDGRLTAMMIDVDDFKRINDSFGHDHGDAVLKRIAATIFGEVAAVNAARWIVARLGGEEFVVVVEGLAPSAVARLAERICNQVHLSVGAGARLEPVTVSVGVAIHRPGMGIDRLLKAADDAVYAAKRSGRDRWAFASDVPAADAARQAAAT